MMTHDRLLGAADDKSTSRALVPAEFEGAAPTAIAAVDSVLASDGAGAFY